MAAMMVHGSRVLRDVIAEAKEEGCRYKVRRDVRLDTRDGNFYVPEYLELDGKKAILPPNTDHDSIIGPEVVEYIWRRLGLDHKITW